MTKKENEFSFEIKTNIEENEIDGFFPEEEFDEILSKPTPLSDEVDPFPPPKKKVLELSKDNEKILDFHRIQRAETEAYDVGGALFIKAPDYLQKRIVDLILVVNSVSCSDPRTRKRVINKMIMGCLDGAAKWIMERKKDYK